MIERSLSDQHLKGENPNCPNIDKIIIGLALKNLGADIVKGTAVGISPLLAINSPPKIA
jgi:hypothetical protein